MVEVVCGLVRDILGFQGVIYVVWGCFMGVFEADGSCEVVGGRGGGRL